MARRTSLLCCAWLLSLSANTFAGDEATYLRDIRPLLKERCYACHGTLKQEGGLRLDTGELIRQGSDNGPIVEPLQVQDSVLLERVRTTDESIRMPPIGHPLKAEEIRHLETWIASGAPSPADEQPEPAVADHWAFRKPVRPDVPEITDSDWPANPIDQFVRYRQEQQGLTPAAPAAPAHLLRRVTLDLTGLPPTAEQLAEFLEDPSPEHYAQVVDRLLASPQYGERWGRHWMDVWRYSDWYGRRDQNDVRNSAPQIWRWRDWIIDSLNADKGYAQMIREMLAADELCAEDDSTWPATGYLIRSYYSLNPNEWMRHNVEYTGKAFLGLTFNCAHCHDHKYDPIAHDDYFRLRAFFEPMGIRQDRASGEPEPPPFEPYVYGGSRKVVRTGMVRIYDEKPDAPTWFYTGGDERNRMEDRGTILPGVPEFLNIPFDDITTVELPMSGWYPGARPGMQQQSVEEHQQAIVDAQKQYDEAAASKTDTTELQRQHQTALAALEDARGKAIAAGEQGALAGEQSLLIDAPEGRRVLQQFLDGLQSVPDGMQIRFKLHLLRPGHFNFQLARDSASNQTALYVGFEAGQIRAYRPGGFREFIAGTYPEDQTAGHMAVSLTIRPEQDRAVLRVELLDANVSSRLVDDVEIALNGWDPSQKKNQPFTLDCHNSGRVLIDDISVTAGDQSWSWDFEAPRCRDGHDVVGIRGWSAHGMSTGAAKSLVSSMAGCRSAQGEYDALLQAQAALDAATQPLRAAELTLQAAQLKLAAIQAVIKADNTRRDGEDADLLEQASRTACNAQRHARETDAQARLLNAELQLITERQATEPNKEAIQSLEKQLTTARTDLKNVQEERAKSPDSTEYQRLSPMTSQQSTGRRSALANWITHPDNPLTPRVAVNHLWMRHFHVPLVESVYDFGRNGKHPSHPQLMDWLSVELQQHDWSMKHLHRLIVTSRTYQMSSSGRGLEKNRSIDEENRWLWRMNAGRMEAEVVRDSLLAVSGRLDQTLGGPVLLNTEAMTTFRRSLYYEVYPEDGGNIRLAEVFDAPSPGECFRRTSTVMPQQALALSNNELTHEAAQLVTEQISQLANGQDDVFVDQCFRRILCRPPTPQEQDIAMAYLTGQRELFDTDAEVRQGFVRAILNHNDFLTIR